MISYALLLIPLMSVSQVTVDPADLSKNELNGWQGEWALLRSVREGEATPEERIRNSPRHTIKDQKWFPNRDPFDYTYLFADPRLNPKWIDVTDRDGKKMLGIYQLKGDKLTLCLAKPGAPRPKTFVSTKEGRNYLVELKRAPKPKTNKQ